jgi:hypothetical protein
MAGGPRLSGPATSINGKKMEREEERKKEVACLALYVKIAAKLIE